MAKIQAKGPNAEQIEYWNSAAGPKWVRLQEMIDAQLAIFGEAAAGAAGIAAGATILDVGCGCGTTTLELAGITGPRGRAVGIDVSATMLERATERAREAGASNVTFENGDAQSHRFDESAFDVIYSRFGVMFFLEPALAFANLRRALRTGGRLAFVCWQPAAENPWMMVPTLAAAEHLTLEIPADPFAPGPFSFGDSARVRAILAEAGFVDVAVEELRPTMSLGGGLDVDEAVTFITQLGPAAKPLAEADDDTRLKVQRAVHAALEPYRAAGGISMPSAAWIVTATTE